MRRTTAARRHEVRNFLLANPLYWIEEFHLDGLRMDAVASMLYLTTRAGQGSLLSKMPGDRWQQFANLRTLLAWMWAHPGRPLLFMGGETSQNGKWDHDTSMDGHLLGYPKHAGMQALVRALNTIHRPNPPWEQDFDLGGFGWIDPDDSDNSVLSFLRFLASAGRPVARLANLTPVPRHDYRIGLPESGRWTEILNSDNAGFGGSNTLTGTVTCSRRRTRLDQADHGGSPTRRHLRQEEFAHAALVLPVHDQGVHPVPGHADLRERIDGMAGE